MSFLDLAKSRYTAKKYNSDEKISYEKIEELKEILLLSPSSINSQPWKFTFVSDEKVKRNLASVSYFNDQKIIEASHLVVFSVIDNIEILSTELNLASLGELKVPEQRHIEVPAAGIIQEVSASIAKGQSSRRYKLRWITQQWAKALRIVRRFGQSIQYVGVRGCDAETAGNSSVVGERNTGIASAVDDSERRTRLNDRYSRDLPATENVVHDRGAAVSDGL